MAEIGRPGAPAPPRSGAPAPPRSGASAPPSSGASAPPLLEMRGVCKRFGTVAALAGVDLVLDAGEVHALVGENGAGKSTLMKVLSGALLPDGGEMRVSGMAYRPDGPLAAGRRGIAMIYQELNLADDLSVVENVVLGREPQRLGFLRRAAAQALAKGALARLGRADLAGVHTLSELGPGERQLVEVARALVVDARIVVMDEPTSSLSAADTERLFVAIARLKQEGVAVIYISHFLEEVTRIADRYTVLRDGRSVSSGAIAETSQAQLVEQMVGRKLAEIFPRVPHEATSEVLALSELCGRRLPKQASLSLRRGEILGLAGLVGAGRTELVRAVFGLDPVKSGRIVVASVGDQGRAVASVGDQGRAPWERLRQGIGLLSEDRKDEGLALGMTIAENLTLSHLGKRARFGFLGRSRQLADVGRWIEALGIRAPDPSAAAGTLSGGNQQKVALARLMDLDVDVLLLDEPTRGVDVGSKAQIYQLIGELAAQGKAVLFISSYVPELLGVCDRVAVMHRGQLLPARAASGLCEADVLAQATAGAEAAQATAGAEARA